MSNYQHPIPKPLLLGKKPNLYDSRVMSTALRVLELADECYQSKSGNKELHSSMMPAIFGHHLSSSGKYFRSLFRQVGTYHHDPSDKANGWSFTYRPKDAEIGQLRAAVEIATNSDKSSRGRANPWATNSDNHSITVVSRCLSPGESSTNSDNHNSEYLTTVVSKRRCDLSNGSFLVEPPLRSNYGVVRNGRSYDWWVTMKSEVRVAKFVSEHGRMFDYDISAAAPTLLLGEFRQQVQAKNRFGQEMLKKLQLPTWTRLVEQPTEFRAELAAELKVMPKDAKLIAQRLLNGGFAARHKDNGFVRDYGWETTELILRSDTCNGLRADFKLFKAFAPLLSQKSAKSTGSVGQKVSLRYAQVENRVMSVIESCVSTPCWFVHDGFFSAEPQDVNFIIQQVKERTGITINITTDLHHSTLS